VTMVLVGIVSASVIVYFSGGTWDPKFVDMVKFPFCISMSPSHHGKLNDTDATLDMYSVAFC